MSLNIKHFKTIVIKIGSNLIVDPKSNRLQEKWLKSFAKDVAKLIRQKKRVILVVSGAIAVACKIQKKDRRGLSLSQTQAMAAIGQVKLLEILKKRFKKNKIDIAQILLTGSDSESRERYLNIKATLENLLDMGVLAIINENDTVATDEIRFGDNDQLSARVSQVIDSDLLILFSDVNGLYDKNPKTEKDARLIKKIAKIDDRLIKNIDNKLSEFGTGGMVSKVEAARLATLSGSDVIISSGKHRNPISALTKKDAQYSLFKKAKTAINARKKWLSQLKEKGVITIDEGAVKALKNNKSLLPVGVKTFQGKFQIGDIVKIKGPRNKNIAKGIANISNKDLKNIAGKKTEEILKENNNPIATTIVHKDNLILENV